MVSLSNHVPGILLAMTACAIVYNVVYSNKRAIYVKKRELDLTSLFFT